ncbi:MAG TPA: mannosyltransferase family protein [Ktedonobacterales bacterium]|jgi:hypothetical protein
MAIKVNGPGGPAVAEAPRGTDERPRGGYARALAAYRRWSGTHWGHIWVDALFVFGLSRLIFLALTYLVPSLLIAPGQPRPQGVVDPLRLWFTQDAAHFIYIAQHGYDQMWRTAFFPLFPLLEHVAAPVFGGDYGFAGLFISNAAFLGALVILRDLLERDFNAEVAHRATLYLAIFPTAFYFFAPYSESLFLLFGIGSFAALRQRRWWLAGLLGGIAALDRSQAILLALPFAYELWMAWRKGQSRLWNILWAGLIPAGVLVYAAYLGVVFHDPLAFSQAQAYWTRGLQWPGESIVNTLQTLAAGHQPAVLVAHMALNLLALLTFIVLSVIVLRRLPLSYGLYTVATLLFILLVAPTYGAIALQSSGRFVATLFPVFVLLAQWSRRPRLHEVLMVGQVAALVLLSIHFMFSSSWGNIPLWWK